MYKNLHTTLHPTAYLHVIMMVNFVLCVVYRNRCLKKEVEPRDWFKMAMDKILN